MTTSGGRLAEVAVNLLRRCFLSSVRGLGLGLLFVRKYHLVRQAE